MTDQQPAPEGQHPTPAEQKALSERLGIPYNPTWLSPVCSITPRHWNNHTACDYRLCTCGHHRRLVTAQTAPAQGEAVSASCQTTLW